MNSIAMLRMLHALSDRIDSLSHWFPQLDDEMRNTVADSNTEINERKLLSKYPDIYKQFEEKIRCADIVVFNAEGMFIMSTPIRLDLVYRLIAMRMCERFNKPYFVTNGHFSPPADVNGNGLLFLEADGSVLSETLFYLRKAKLISTRDRLSRDYLLGLDKTLNVEFTPDAVFSLKTHIESMRKQLDYMRMIPHLSLSHNRSEYITSLYNFEKDYVLLSGNVFATRYGGPNKADAFTYLAEAIKKKTELYGIPIFLLESNDGDAMLRFQVHERTKIPFIPVTTNIFLLANIIENSRLLVSGQYHPSIIASMGGTPFVMMGADAIKNEGVIDVLGLEGDAARIYPSVPNKEESDEIASAVERELNKTLNRAPLLERCDKLCIDSQSIVQKIKERI
jgi:hypothetical protein